MVWMLSQLIALGWSRPFCGPTRTSVDRPRMVLVMGATVTLVRRGRISSRVRTTTGRGLSRRAMCSGRMTSYGGSVEVAEHGPGGRRGEPLQIRVVTVLGQDREVAHGQLPPPLTLHRPGHHRGPARRLVGGHELVHEVDQLVRQPHSDLLTHTKTIPPWD